MNFEIPSFQRVPPEQRLLVLANTTRALVRGLWGQVESNDISYVLAYVATEFGLHVTRNDCSVFAVVLNGVEDATRVAKAAEERRLAEHAASHGENVVPFRRPGQPRPNPDTGATEAEATGDGQVPGEVRGDPEGREQGSRPLRPGTDTTSADNLRDRSQPGPRLSRAPATRSRWAQIRAWFQRRR
jgi:hypothetical protein